MLQTDSPQIHSRTSHFLLETFREQGPTARAGIARDVACCPYRPERLGCRVP